MALATAFILLAAFVLMVFGLLDVRAFFVIAAASALIAYMFVPRM